LAAERVAAGSGRRDAAHPLDAGARHDRIEELRVPRTGLLGALTAAALRRQLTAGEDAALGWAIDAVTAPGGPTPTLTDVAVVLADPTAEMAHHANESPRELARRSQISATD
jgi:hypothetical protein